MLGNADRDVIEAQPGPSAAWWTRAQLDADALAYPRSLPIGQRVTPAGGASPDADLLVVHASPGSVDPVLILEPHPLGTTFTRRTPPASAAALLGDTCAEIIVYGHIHYASAGSVRGRRLASIGSIGFPFDGDRRAAYAICRWNGAHWQVEHRRVAYDVERVADAVRCS